MKILAVVQARYASTRLPGKVLTNIGGKPALAWVVEAAKRAIGVDGVVVATSTNPENNSIIKWCKDNDTLYFRGSETDVLDRYQRLIGAYKCDAVVRLTGDCVLADSHVIGEVVALYKHAKVAYASNVEPPTWPDGLDTEVISSDALIDAAAHATRASDRDTVTRYISRNQATYPSINLSCPLNLNKERWVLDSPEDLVFIERLLSHFKTGWVPNYLDILQMLEKYPELRKINAQYSRNERFYQGLASEPPYVRSYAKSQLALLKAERTVPFGAQTFSKSKFQFPPEDSPLFVTHGDGGYVFDVDGNDYVDLVGALLPNVLGYRDPDVDYAVRRQLDNGVSFSLATGLEADLSERLVHHIPCAEMVKLGKTGSDVTTAAIRLARAATNRDAVISQGYHGWHDWSMALSPRNAGIPEATKLSIRNIAANDVDTVKWLLAHAWKIAAVIIEPEGWNPVHLRELRDICRKDGIVLIFDEIITGFRWSIGGYQKYIGITPDLACFGKSMANGMPISALVGQKDLMMRTCPPDNIFYSGTFFGETLSIAGAIATIDKMVREPVIQHLWKMGSAISHSARTRIKAAGLENAIRLRGDAPLIRVEFGPFGDLKPEQMKSLFIKNMTAAGVLVIASHNVCYAHSETELSRICKAYDAALDAILGIAKSGDVPSEIPTTASVR